MPDLISSLLICLNLTRLEASNGLVLRYHMEQNCTVVRSAQGKGKGNKEPWLNATLDCKCKGISK